MKVALFALLTVVATFVSCEARFSAKSEPISGAPNQENIVKLPPGESFVRFHVVTTTILDTRYFIETENKRTHTLRNAEGNVLLVVTKE